jgi:hypothetical protein
LRANLPREQQKKAFSCVQICINRRAPLKSSAKQ